MPATQTPTRPRVQRNLYLDEHLVERLEADAKRLDVSVSHVARALLRSHYAEQAPSEVSPAK